MNILENIITNFNKDHVLTFEKEEIVDNEIVKIAVNLTHIENICSIKVSVALDKTYCLEANSIINSLNSHPAIGIYQIEDGFLNLLVSVWQTKELVNDELNDIVDVLTSEIATTSSMIKWRKENFNGR